MKTIDNDIKEPLVSFELAKLLAENGFNVGTRLAYTSDKKLQKPYYGELYKNGDNDNDVIYEAPTHALALLWVQKNYRMTLLPNYFYYDGVWYGYKYFKPNGDYGEFWKDNDGESPDGCDTMEEATEYAIKEVLLNTLKLF